MPPLPGWLALWLRAVSRFVPTPRREAWTAEWRAELRHERHRLCPSKTMPLGDHWRLWRAASGAWRDAFTIRRLFHTQFVQPAPVPARVRTEFNLKDITFAFRTLRKNPTFTFIAIVTLAVGLGANAAIFSLIDAVILRPLPYPEAERLVALSSRVPGNASSDRWGLSEAGYFYFQQNSKTLESIGAYLTGTGNLAGDRAPERVQAAYVTATFLDVLQARPLHGRTIGQSDDAPSGAPVILLSHDFWRRRYGNDVSIVGRSVLLDETPREVIGVLEPGIDLPDVKVDVWLPLGLDPTARPMNAHYLNAIAKMPPGTRVETAATELASITARFPELFPDAYSEEFMRRYQFQTAVTPLRREVIGDTDKVLWILFGAVGLVLAIAWANVGNLFLVRAHGRQREIALRTALGASRGALVRLFLAEGLLLSVASAALGTAVGLVGVRALLQLVPDSLPRVRELAGFPGLTTVAFVALLTLIVGVLLAVVPFVGRRGTVLAELQRAGRGTTESPSTQLIRSSFVIAQVGIAMVLVAAAALTVKSFSRLHAVLPGFDPNRAVVFDIRLAPAAYPRQPEVELFYRELIDRLAASPGVSAVGAVNNLPLTGRVGCFVMGIEGAPPASTERDPCPATKFVTPGYFAASGVRVIQGREFESVDNVQRTGAVIVNRAFAEQTWPGESALGQGLRIFPGTRPDQTWYRVIGVVDNVRHNGVDQPAPAMVYYSLLASEGQPQWGPNHFMSVIMRGRSMSPQTATGVIQSAVHELDPNLPVANIRALSDVLGKSVARASFTMILLAIAGAVAMLLGYVGIYGVFSYLVRRRRSEIGVRMALGARAGQVQRLVVLQSLRLAGIGVVVGVVAAVFVSGALATLLFEVSPTDPLTLALVSLAVVSAAAAASYFPSRRAARIDPAMVLREE